MSTLTPSTPRTMRHPDWQADWHKRAQANAGPPPIVVLVDDEPDTLAEYGEALALTSIHCVTAGSGGPALELIDAMPTIDVVLTDLRMPGTDGRSLLAGLQLRAVERPWLRSIIVTGHVDADVAVESIRYGVHGFLRKPVGRDELIDVVVSAASRATSIRADLARQNEHAGQLRDLASEIARLGSLVQRLETAAKYEHGELLPARTETPIEEIRELWSVPSEARRLVDVLRRTMRARTTRAEYFPSDLFSDPAWDMLLDLALARLTGKRVSVSSLCLAAGVPATTALRRLDDLCAAKMTTRLPDAADGRRKFVELTDDGARRMLLYLESLQREGTR